MGAGGGNFDDVGVDLSAMNALVESFMRVMGDQPLSLALCVMNLLLLAYCFRQAKQFSETRREMAKMIIKWQEDTQRIMADCVSKDTMKVIVDALERDRELYRAMLPSHRSPEQSSAK